MTTALAEFVAAEASSGPTADGLYGISTVELHALGTKCLEARATAYCKLTMLQLHVSGVVIGRLRRHQY